MKLSVTVAIAALVALDGQPKVTNLRAVIIFFKIECVEIFANFLNHPILWINSTDAGETLRNRKVKFYAARRFSEFDR